MLSPALTSVLSSERDYFNVRFELYKHRYPKLEGEVFKGFVLETLVPFADEAARVVPERLPSIVHATYDVGLSLVGQGLAGPGARVTSIELGLRRLAPRWVRFIAEEPERVLSALCNALHHLGLTRGARLERWVEDMERLAPAVASVEELLRLGQVAAWCAGLSHYRSGALTLCDQLPEAINRALLRVPTTTSWADARVALAANPWHDPAGEAPQLRWVGGFRGLDGLFVEPPRVAASGEQILVESGAECWLLVADAFGATFSKATTMEREQAGPFALDRRLSVSAGVLCFDGRPTEVRARGALTSAAAVAGTFAATFSQSHDVAVLPSEAV